LKRLLKDRNRYIHFCSPTLLEDFDVTKRVIFSDETKRSLHCCPSAICSSARHPCALRARDIYQVSKMSSQGVLGLLRLLAAHSTWQHLQSLEDKERSPSREASS
jgi:hypothetical protein